jgi:hypothetical protein
MTGASRIPRIRAGQPPAWWRRLLGSRSASLPEPGPHEVAVWIALRLLALAYLAAFWPLAREIVGLAGSQGIVPWREGVRAWEGFPLWQRLWIAPTLCWLLPGDGWLQALPLVGMGLSVLAFLGLFQRTALALLWILYLSLVTVGGPFLRFQWDALLLEMGFLAPWLVGPPREAWWGLRPVRRWVFWLYRLLLFKLVFSSGVVKLSSGDASWRELTALRYHFETQPLPNPVAWYLHAAPAILLEAATGLVLVLELAVPFLLFAPRRWRHAGALLLAAYVLLIQISGNHGMFNWLVLVLCALQLDDRFWGSLLLRPAPDQEGSRGTGWLGTRWLWPLVGLLLLLDVVHVGDAFRRRLPWPQPVRMLAGILTPFQINQAYGLYAVMTTRRPQIVVEGSRDGKRWKPYRWRFQPNGPEDAPPWAGLYMPRLDWQAWFAALGTPRENPWVLALGRRLLEGRGAVLRLFEENPFPGLPPRFVRIVLYEDRFTTPAERRETGHWWVRRRLGIYLPPFSLANPPAPGTLTLRQGGSPGEPPGGPAPPRDRLPAPG